MAGNAGAAPDDRARRARRRPGNSDAWRQVIGVGRDGLEKLQVVSKAGVERHAWSDLPFVLRVEAHIRIPLRHSGRSKRLREAGVVVRPRQEIRERGKRVRTAVRPRKRDLVVIQEQVYPRFQRVPAGLMREVVHDLVHPVRPSRGTARQRTK